MSLYLRRSVAEKSKIYQDIKLKAMEYLNSTGSFRKAKVITDLRLEVFEDSIRWDYVRDMIQAESAEDDVDLIPMAEAYFKTRIVVGKQMEKNTPELRLRIPERFIAAGHGKKTAGYVRAIAGNGHFIEVVARNKYAQARGTRASAERFDAKARAVGITMPNLARVK